MAGDVSGGMADNDDDILVGDDAAVNADTKLFEEVDVVEKKVEARRKQLPGEYNFILLGEEDLDCNRCNFLE